MKGQYLIVLVLLIGGLGLMVARGNNSDPKQNTPIETSITESEAESASANTVVYTQAGFSPSSIIVEAGTTVRFINQSERQMWVASNPHPVHTDYSAFDQLGAGDEYSFTFTESGSYPYHNHLVPTATGVVTVQ